MTKAKNLPSAISAFTPQPIRFADGDLAPPFYVARDDASLRDLKTSLLHGHETEKTFVAGHRGTGKSTELNRLTANRDVLERFVVVKVAVRERLDLNDLTYIDLLVAIVAQVVEVLDDEHPELRVRDPQAIQRLAAWAKHVEVIEESEQRRGHDVEAGLRASLGGLLRLGGRAT